MPAPGAWGLSVGGTAAERVATAKARFRDLRRERDQAVAQARAAVRTRMIDGVLVLEGDEQMVTEAEVERRRDFAEKQVRQRFDPQIEELRQQVVEDRDTLQRIATETRPALADDALTQQKAVMAWEQSIKPRLEAGMRPSDILANADVTTALALAEWGPSWMPARDHAARPKGMDGLGWKPADTSSLTKAVDARLAELDEDFGTYRTAAVEAEKSAAEVTPILERDAGRSNLSPLEAALSGHYASQSVEIEHGLSSADEPAPGDGGEGDASGDAA